MLANPDTYGISVLEFSLVTVLPDPDLPKIKFPNNDDLDWLRNLVLCLLKGWDSRVGYGAVEKIRVTLSYRGAVRGFSGCDSMIFYHFAAIFLRM
jgi:hypothetical protein